MPWTLASAVAGWGSTLIVVAAALTGLVLRRLWKRAPFIRRMRPHYIVGYVALALALAHVFFAMVGVQNANASGIRVATLALGVLGTQTFIGASLQDPGSYRQLLRGWHIAAFVIIVVLVAVHIIANGASALL